jgi:hypothetical protein
MSGHELVRTRRAYGRVRKRGQPFVRVSGRSYASRSSRESDDLNATIAPPDGATARRTREQTPKP